MRAIHQLAQASAGERDAERIYARVRGYLDAAQKRSAEAGYSESEQRQIGYALTAFADEAAMSAPGALRDHWSKQPLQLALFGDNVAGERFFDELERARHEERIDVVRTYQLCLLLGFRGRLAVSGGEAALDTLLTSLRAQLSRSLAMPERLSPDGLRPEQRLVGDVRRLPWVASALLVLAVSGVVYLGCRVALEEQRASLAKQVSP